MTLSDWASIASIVQGVFVIISIAFIWFQLRENTRLTRASNTQTLVDLSSPFNLQLIQDREMARLWVQGASNYDTLDEIDKYRYYSLIAWWLILHENIFYQWKKQLIDQETYGPWDHELKKFISRHPLNQFWTELRGNFQPAFEKYLEQIIFNKKE